MIHVAGAVDRMLADLAIRCHTEQKNALVPAATGDEGEIQDLERN